MSDTSSSPEVLRNPVGPNDRWYDAMMRHAAAVARLHARGMPGVPDTLDIPEEEEAAFRDLMLAPVPSFDLLPVKFRLFRELFDALDGMFVDRRELVFLAAIEADVLRLADELKQQ